MKRLLSFLRFTFGCRHRQRSAVFTIKKRTYQVCLKCGKEFDYSWALMHSVHSSIPGPPDEQLHGVTHAEVPLI